MIFCSMQSSGAPSETILKETRPDLLFGEKEVPVRQEAIQSSNPTPGCNRAHKTPTKNPRGKPRGFFRGARERRGRRIRRSALSGKRLPSSASVEGEAAAVEKVGGVRARNRRHLARRRAVEAIGVVGLGHVGLFRIEVRVDARYLDAKGRGGLPAGSRRSPRQRRRFDPGCRSSPGRRPRACSERT